MNEKTWNLTDTLNTDLNSGSLFDGLPENGKKLEARVEGSNGSKFATDTNLRADMGQSKVLDSPAESTLKSPAIFDGLPESPEKPLVSARVNGTPTAPSLGDTFVKVRGILQKMDAHRKANDYGKPIERGINRAQYETAASALMQKFGDDIENTYGIPSGDVPQLFTDVSKSNAGFRSKEDIDRIHSIVKNGVPDFVDTKGNTVALPKNMSFAQAIEVDNQMFTSSLKGKEPVDAVKELGQITEQLSKLRDKDGNLIAGDGNEALNENLLARRDAVMKLPTGTSAFSTSFNRLNVEDNNLSYAESAGVGYKNLEPGQITARRLQINQDRVALAIQHAPTFGDKGGMQKYLTDPETKGLPFKETVNGIPTILFPTDKENIYKQWSSSEKTWKIFDANKKEEPNLGSENAAAEAASPNESGKRLGAAGKRAIQKTANAIQKTANYLEGPTMDELLNRADYVATGIRNNITAPAVELAAGVAGENLDLGRTSNPSVADRDKKQLTPKERAAILTRTHSPLTSLIK